MNKDKAIDVSIIIVNYNTFKMTCDCINSIYKNTKSLSFEIILVDNDSKECDGDLFLKSFPEIILVKSNSNVGFAKGNNLGIQKATGKYILLLNSDTVLKDNAIKISIDYLENHPKAGIMSVGLVFPDGAHQSVCQRFPSIRYQLFELLRLHKLVSKKVAGRILLGSFFKYDENIKSDWVWGTYFMFRKEILELLPNKKLNDDFFMYCEDMQWCWDFRTLGYEIHYCSETQVLHYSGGSSGNRHEMMKQNNRLFLENNYSPIHRMFINFLNRLLKTQ